MYLNVLKMEVYTWREFGIELMKYIENKPVMGNTKTILNSRMNKILYKREKVIIIVKSLIDFTVT